MFAHGQPTRVRAAEERRARRFQEIGQLKVELDWWQRQGSPRH